MSVHVVRDNSVHDKFYACVRVCAGVTLSDIGSNNCVSHVIGFHTQYFSIVVFHCFRTYVEVCQIQSSGSLTSQVRMTDECVKTSLVHGNNTRLMYELVKMLVYSMPEICFAVQMSKIQFSRFTSNVSSILDYFSIGKESSVTFRKRRITQTRCFLKYDFFFINFHRFKAVSL